MPNNNKKYIVTIVILIVLLLIALIFGMWAYSGRSNNRSASQQVATNQAVAAAVSNQKAQDDQAAKQPYRTFTGSSTYGSVTFNYPRTWSGLVDTTSSDEPINGYFYPDILPALQSSSSSSGASTALALRVELLNDDYATTVSQFDSSVQSGDLTATAYVPPKMAGVSNVQPGLRLDGAITQDFQGSMVVIKVRDKTLEISTQSKDFLNDFNNTVLPSLSFAP